MDNSVYPQDYRGVLEDGDAAPAAQCVLHICLFLVAQDGIPAAMVADEFLVTCRCTQTVLVNKLQNTSEIIDVGDDED